MNDDTNSADEAAIRNVMDIYINGAVSGSSADLAPAFHPAATIYGYVGPDLFGGPISDFFAWHDNNGPAADLTGNVSVIDIEGTVGIVRLELTNWTGHRFTDFFTLLKEDGVWKIISKVFYLHPE
ncbi:MAG: nuclear transport factor 2 family protein [Acidobacteria bacterium]|nr:nuclear transport factor 2 family protein [Acidobacteriota bacterium]